ncbi:MAG: Hpt domain-containing protein [Candidatus Omnitrophica bacterium]|nr:Hpt domain-containing protein [Candidatus Omnitrophota bacterium]
MNDKVLHLKEFLERVQGDRELLLELFDIYIEDYGVKRKKLEEAIRDENFEEVRNIAHSLKGASGNISAKAMRDLFFQAEEMGRNAKLVDTDKLLLDIDKQYILLEEEINEARKKYKQQ